MCYNTDVMSKIKIFYGLATFVGTVIGVGMFSLPYLAAQTSFVTLVVYLLIFGGAMILLQLAYGEVVLATRGYHELSGYAGLYLGKVWRPITLIVQVLSLTGSSIAYLVVGGEFLWLLLGPVLGGYHLLYILLYFALGSAIVFIGLKSLAKSELIITGLMMILVVVFFAAAWTKIDLATLIMPVKNWSNILWPYGGVLFALSGATIIPEVVEITGGQRRHLKQILIGGTLLAVAIYIMFVASVFGLTGAQTAPDALSAIGQFFSPAIFVGALLFGLLATFTSYIAGMSVIRQSLIEDWRVGSLHSWLAASFPALICYLAGLQNFIGIVSFVGAVGLAFSSFIIFLLYWKVRNGAGQKPPSYDLRLPVWLIGLLIAVLLLGAGLEIFGLFY